MKNNKGITLIALVITIIVLLILAGVSIAMLTGNNGILTQANTAKSDTAKARATEDVLENAKLYQAKVLEDMELNALYSSVLASTTKATFDDAEKTNATNNLGTGYTVTMSTDNKVITISSSVTGVTAGHVDITGAGAATLTPAK